MFFSLWLISLCVSNSRFIHITTTDSILFFYSKQYSIVYMYNNYFIHSSVDGHLGCVHIVAIVNSAAVNFGVHVLFLIMIFSRYSPSSEIAGSYVSFTPSFLWNFHAVLHNGYISLYFYQQCKEVLFSPHPFQHLLFVDFWWWQFWLMWGDTLW